MPTFTVIGLHPSGEGFAVPQEATSAHDAIGKVAKRMALSDAEILGAIEAVGTWTASCEDSGNAAHVTDLCYLDEDDDGHPPFVIEILTEKGGWEVANLLDTNAFETLEEARNLIEEQLRGIWTAKYRIKTTQGVVWEDKA